MFLEISGHLLELITGYFSASIALSQRIHRRVITVPVVRVVTSAFCTGGRALQETALERLLPGKQIQSRRMGMRGESQRLLRALTRNQSKSSKPITPNIASSIIPKTSQSHLNGEKIGPSHNTPVQIYSIFGWISFKSPRCSLISWLVPSSCSNTRYFSLPSTLPRTFLSMTYTVSPSFSGARWAVISLLT